MTAPLIAVTGGTGFLGRRLVPALAAAGFRTRVLSRRPCEPLIEVVQPPDVVTGALEDEASLRRLADGADMVVHAAGLIKARHRRSFFEVNEVGARRVAEFFAGRPMVLVSSLAAREPALSDYAASKRAGEDAVRSAIGDYLTVVRPPAIYGPGDRETLPLFKAVSSPVAIYPADLEARLAVAYVDDVVASIVDMVGAVSRPAMVTIGGDRPAGYGWRELIAAAARAVGRRPFLVPAPPPLVMATAAFSEVLAAASGASPMFTRGKAREALHRNWSVTPEEQGVTFDRPSLPLDEGFARTVAWYRSQGWLN